MRLLLPILASVLVLGTLGLSNVWAPTMIAPTSGDPGQKFTLIDAPDGRIVHGTVAIFSNGGSETTVSLQTTNSGKTAQGTVPTVFGGVYDVKFRQPSGTEISVGTFEVNASAGDPTIDPSIGTRGTFVTITDPQGRIQQGDVMVFYIEGTDPQAGSHGFNNIVSDDGTTITANAPATLTVDIQYFVNVGPDANGPFRFDSLPFFVTSS